MLYTHIKKIMGSVFMLIAAGVIVTAAFALPFLQKAQQNAREKKRYSSRQTFYVKGQEISAGSPFYNSIADLNEDIEALEKSAVTKADDDALELAGIILDSFLESAKHIKSYEDYRYFISMEKRDAIIDKFVLSHIDEYSAATFSNIVSRVAWDMDEQWVIYSYFDLDDEQRAEKLQSAEDKLLMIYKVVSTNDYMTYYRNQIDKVQKDIDEWSREIEALERDIAENPENEELYSGQIESRKRNIELSQGIEIYILEYRIEHDIPPFASGWKSSAVDDMRNSMYDLQYSTIMTREEFETNEYYREDYRTYNSYVKQRQEYINEAAERMLKAERSLDSGKPDMKYVLAGSRAKAIGFLWYSAVISVFTVLIGGGLISKEFRQGTIRLLLIRPKSRMAIILNKTAALVVICFAMYFAAAALNILANGILHGFADYAYPNYTVSGGEEGISFFADYTLKFLICAVPILFMAIFSVFLSTVTHNTAFSVAVPLALMLGSFVFFVFFMNGTVSQRSLEWVFNTPLPYINIFMYYIVIDIWIEININIAYGTGLILALTSVTAAAGALKFKMSDIKN